jgi:hypothetical protein
VKHSTGRQLFAVVGYDRRFLVGREFGMGEGEPDGHENELFEQDLLVTERAGEHAGPRPRRIIVDHLRRLGLQQDQRAALILRKVGLVHSARNVIHDFPLSGLLGVRKSAAQREAERRGGEVNAAGVGKIADVVPGPGSRRRRAARGIGSDLGGVEEMARQVNVGMARLDGGEGRFRRARRRGRGCERCRAQAAPPLALRLWLGLRAPLFEHWRLRRRCELG